MRISSDTAPSSRADARTQDAVRARYRAPMIASPPRNARSGYAAPRRGLARGALALALVTAFATSLGACANREPAPDAAAATSSPAPTDSTPTVAADPAALAEVARTAGTPLGSGDVTLVVAAPTAPVSVAAQDDGSALLTVAVAGDPDPEQSTGTGTRPDRLAAVLAAPPGLVFEVLTDRSVTVTASMGAVVGALFPVTVVDGAGNRLTARLATRAGDPTLLDVLVSAGPTGAATLTFGADALVSAVWGDREGGRSLAVVPAVWVRAGSLAAQEALWSALVTAEPDADSTSMRDQLTCHALGAPTKESWNLEPWRPAVDSFTLLAARCNP